VAEPARGVPFTTVALDGRVDLALASSRLRWPEARRYPYGSVYNLDGGTRLYLFGFGAIVHESAERIEEPVLKVIEGATGLRYLPETAETYYVKTDPTAAEDSPRIGWDQVVVRDQTPELLGAVAMLLGQSAALERYELQANGLLDDALQLTRGLAVQGRTPSGTRQQIRRVGRIMSDRMELARWFYLVDKPAETWEDARIARVYDALFRNLELKERHEAML
jgi:uncharacterized Rmd1/YagE family protein